MTTEVMNTDVTELAEVGSEDLRVPAGDGEAAKTAEIEKEARTLLNRPDLLDTLVGDVHQRLSGEDTNIKVLMLAQVSRLLPKPMAVVVRGQAGNGKSALVTGVLNYGCQRDIVRLSELTPHALDASGSNLKGKVLYLAEADGSKKAAYQTRTMISEGEVVTLEQRRVGGKPTTCERRAKGPMAFITTTTKAEVDKELETRLLALHVDTSSAQDDRVISAMIESMCGGSLCEEEVEYRRDIWRRASEMLKPYEIQFTRADAERLMDLDFAEGRVRRDANQVRALAEACTLLHQLQREIRDGYLMATSADVDVALALAREVLTPWTNTRLATLKECSGGMPFDASTAATFLGMADDSARRCLVKLEEQRLLERVSYSKGRKGGTWRVIGAEPVVQEAPEVQAA